MYKLNDILFTVYGIIPGRVEGEGIAVKGIFDLPKRIGDTERNWAEADGVEPYVAADELFFEGRTIQFQGIMLGDRATILGNIAALKAAIAAFTDVVPLETPYSNACVYVKTITPKLYNGGASILIEFREPVVGGACGLSTPETVYYSAEYSDDADKNNCQSGYYGSTETLTAPAGAFQSTVSQAAADQLAINWVLENKQAYANNVGFCTINPTTYYSAMASGQLQKDNCPAGFVGSMVTYIVPAGAYTSIIDQLTADALAVADVAATLTQAYANANGSCGDETICTIIELSNTSTGYQGIRTHVFEVGQAMNVGSTFYVSVYSVIISHTVVPGDTPTTVIDDLVNKINTTTEEQWNANNSAPASGTAGFPPTAYRLYNDRLVIEVNHSNQFAAWVINV